MNIFNLQEGKTYNVTHKGNSLNRRFRVNQGELENDGIGRFMPCDWTPLDASLSFSETKTTQGLGSLIFNKISGLVMRIFYSKKGLSLVQLKPGVVYTSNNSVLPSAVIVEDGKLLAFNTKTEVVMRKLSLSTRFFVLSNQNKIEARKIKVSAQKNQEQTQKEPVK